MTVSSLPLVPGLLRPPLFSQGPPSFRNPPFFPIGGNFFPSDTPPDPEVRPHCGEFPSDPVTVMALFPAKVSVFSWRSSGFCHAKLFPITFFQVIPSATGLLSICSLFMFPCKPQLNRRPLYFSLMSSPPLGFVTLTASVFPL